MKKPKLSPRETVMLIFLVILLVAAIYYMGFLTPLNAELDALEAETADLDTQISSFQDKLAKMKDMQTQLEEIKNKPEDEISEMPPYDNVVEIMSDLDSYLREHTHNYSLTHSDPEPSDDGTYRRLIGLSMTCDSLEDAHDIITELDSGKWRCLISYYDFYPVTGIGIGGGGEISLMLSLVFFELPPSATSATPANSAA